MKLLCNKCGYNWDYKGKLMRPTCPSCKSTVNVQTKSKKETSDPEALVREATDLLGVAAQRLNTLNHLHDKDVPEHIHSRIDELRNDIKKIL